MFRIIPQFVIAHSIIHTWYFTGKYAQALPPCIPPIQFPAAQNIQINVGPGILVRSYFETNSFTVLSHLVIWQTCTDNILIITQRVHYGLEYCFISNIPKSIKTTYFYSDSTPLP